MGKLPADDRPRVIVEFERFSTQIFVSFEVTKAVFQRATQLCERVMWPASQRCLTSGDRRTRGRRPLHPRYSPCVGGDCNRRSSGSADVATRLKTHWRRQQFPPVFAVQVRLVEVGARFRERLGAAAGFETRLPSIFSPFATRLASGLKSARGVAVNAGIAFRGVEHFAEHLQAASMNRLLP